MDYIAKLNFGDLIDELINSCCGVDMSTDSKRDYWIITAMQEELLARWRMVAENENRL